MCYICANNGIFTPREGKTLVASQADVDKATSYLHTLGFSGLTFEDHPEDNWIRLKFKDFNKYILDKTFGAAKKASMGRIQWIVPNLGAIYVNEKRKRVLIHNIEKIEKKSPPKPLSPEDIPPLNPSVDTKPLGSPQLVELYKKTQANGSFATRMDFMKRAWDYWNDHKFGGRMEPPTFGFLRDTGAKLKKRGMWRYGGDPLVRQISISPRLFNARFDVFAEIFLHEMCHQAVSEIDKTRERSNQGHGPLWAAWMRKCGLEANRYDRFDNIEYMTPQEREVVQKQRDLSETLKQGMVPNAHRPSELNKEPVPAARVSPDGKVENGFLFFNPMAPKQTNFITDMQLKVGDHPAGSFKWIIFRAPPQIFQRTEPVPDFTKTALDRLKHRLEKDLEHKLARKQARSQFKYQWRPY